ncbi:hypothetical protein SO802_004195 [Lithocarpus litseifolius]|uniref:Uncharacterized protein n=1 Tax=Lithocarpus litseifolius TaxID=425828 RepID=A0AAW2E358_9ROSI
MTNLPIGDIPIGGLDLEEEEHAAPTNAESQKKQLIRSNRIKALQIREQDHVRPQWGSKSEYWLTQEDVPIGGLDLEEEEYAAPTDVKSQKKQLRRSNRIKALQIREQDQVHPQWGSKSENWWTQEGVPIGGLDLEEEEEYATPTDTESQK